MLVNWQEYDIKYAICDLLPMNNMSQSFKICYKKFYGSPTPPDPIFTSARDRGCKKPSTNATQHFNTISIRLFLPSVLSQCNVLNTTQSMFCILHYWTISWEHTKSLSLIDIMQTNGNHMISGKDYKRIQSCTYIVIYI